MLNYNLKAELAHCAWLAALPPLCELIKPSVIFLRSSQSLSIIWARKIRFNTRCYSKNLPQNSPLHCTMGWNNFSINISFCVFNKHTLWSVNDGAAVDLPGIRRGRFPSIFKQKKRDKLMVFHGLNWPYVGLVVPVICLLAGNPLWWVSCRSPAAQSLMDHRVAVNFVLVLYEWFIVKD